MILSFPSKKCSYERKCPYWQWIGKWPVPVVRRANIQAVCCKDNYIPMGKFKLFNSLFHSVYLVFSIRLFSIANLFVVRYLWDEDKMMLCRDISRGRHSRRLAVYVRKYCVPIVAFNQNNRSRLLYLGDAQIKNQCLRCNENQLTKICFEWRLENFVRVSRLSLLRNTVNTLI